MQIDVVLKSGVGVFNVVDVCFVEMVELCDGEVIFFVLLGDLEVIVVYCVVGKWVVFVCDGKVVFVIGVIELILVDVLVILLIYVGCVLF